jgi:hypothetical protein
MKIYNFFVILTVVIFTFVACEPRDTQPVLSGDSAYEGDQSQRQTREEQVVGGNGMTEEDRQNGEYTSNISEEDLLERMTFEDKLYHDWDFDIFLYPEPTDGDYDLGTILQRDGQWSAFFDGEYAVMYLKEMQVQQNNVIFELERWGRSPEDPMNFISPPEDRFQYLVTLTEKDLDEVLIKGLSKESAYPGMVISAKRIEK